ncbi:MAG TPA: hypothetical protein EYQ50_21110 [Verrucomicrobiales bacterium]|nr:hypothetical protein [Verrucomicrobiales bacterium]
MDPTLRSLGHPQQPPVLSVQTFSSPGFFLMTGTGLLGLFSIGSGCVGLSRKKSVDKPFRL